MILIRLNQSIYPSVYRFPSFLSMILSINLINFLSYLSVNLFWQLSTLNQF